MIGAVILALAAYPVALAFVTSRRKLSHRHKKT
jgi:hypothetical protein